LPFGREIPGLEPAYRESSARRISAFYGIFTRMFFNDHRPPHFHIRYGEFEATIEIDTLNILEGALLGRAFEPRAGMGDDAQRGIVG
jgi:hypothetical protein